MAFVKQKCDFCDEAATYDAKTLMGPWAYMCDKHYEQYGSRIPGMFSKLVASFVPSKVCVICGQDKPINEFYKYTDHSGTKRYRNECKQCNSERRKKQRDKT